MRTFRRAIGTMIAVIVSISAMAFDFSLPTEKGYSLYFNIVDEENHLCEVTSPLNDGGSRWSGYEMPIGILEIPVGVEYEGEEYNVVGISDHAFSYCAEINSLVLPPALTYIGNYAFAQCIGLRGAITIGENIVSIGRSAFVNCTGITEVRFNAENCETMGGSRSSTPFGNCISLKKVVFGDGVRRIPDFAFTGMDMLKNEWNLPASLEYIGEYAFAYCYSIKGMLRIPSGVTVIGPYAFAQCHAMTSLILPESLQRIDQRAFYQCVGLKQIKASSLVPPVVGAEAFAKIGQKAMLSVPCIGEARYRADAEWSSVGKISVQSPCMVNVKGIVLEPENGTIIGAGRYRLGDTATLVAACRAGYSFISWTDGNTDNPRRVVVNDTTSYRAEIKEATVEREVEYVHDTLYLDGVEVRYEYYEVNDVATAIQDQGRIVYNRSKRRIEVDETEDKVLDMALYNAAGRCVFTGRPRHGRVNMRRMPTGSYVVRVSTYDDEYFLKFFHSKTK